MKKEQVLTKEKLNELLGWLGGGQEISAAIKYEQIRSRLIDIFARRGCPVAEDLADHVIDRVASKLPELAQEFVGDPALYFYEVGRYIHMEYVRSAGKNVPIPINLRAPDPQDVDESVFECLQQCLEQQTPENRSFILEYYQGKNRERIDNRKKIAITLNAKPSTIRMRAQRIRSALEDCVRKCTELSSIEPRSDINEH